MTHSSTPKLPLAKRFDLFFILTLLFEVAMIILFSLCVTYGTDDLPGTNQTNVNRYWPFYTDVTVMIFVGFGFLMTFLHKHAYSAVGYTYLISAFCVQWALLCIGFMEKAYEGHYTFIELRGPNLIDAQFAAGSVMICFGALIGKVTPLQMMLVAFFQVMVYAVNFTVLTKWMMINDIGGSLGIHMFGAYFGLAASAVLSPRVKTPADEKRYSKGIQTVYTLDVFAMIGTVFLWVCWPSFNAALAPQHFQLRAVSNTLLSLCSCCVTTFMLSRFFRGEGKFYMVDIQNATLAGGVAVGSAADMIIGPGAAIGVGMASAVVSVFGFVFLQPFLERRTFIRDTCGVHNLHGMPGFLGGVIAALSTAAATQRPDIYGHEIFNMFFKRGGYTVGYQFAGIFVALGFAIVGGALTGFIVKLICRAPIRMFSDAEFWEVPPDFDDSMLDVEEASDAHCEERSSPTVSPKEVEMSVVVDSEVTENENEKLRPATPPAVHQVAE